VMEHWKINHMGYASESFRSTPVFDYEMP